MESQPASDSDSDETIVEGSVQGSEDEAEERRVERMLFIHKNAFQLYHTMSDFTSGTEAPFGGSSSPVIQMIPKTKCFRLHMENHQQQVKTLQRVPSITWIVDLLQEQSSPSHLVGSLGAEGHLVWPSVLGKAYDESMQLGQSQNLLRSGVTCLTGVSSSDGTSPHVTHVDIEHNYSREYSEDTDETMLDTEMSNDLPAQNSEQEISDDESTPEVNLLTGALITSCTSTHEKRTAFADELSAGNCTSNMPPLFSRRNSPLESFNVSKAETADTMQGSLSQALPQEEISAQGNFEQNISSGSTRNKIPIMDLLRPLTNESRSSSLTTMNLSPLMDSLDALSDGAATTESLAERQDALPVELLAALNEMPLTATVLPVKETLPSVNDKSTINSSTQCVVKEIMPPVNDKATIDLSIQDNLGLKAGVFTQDESNTEIDEDLTQITNYEPNSRPSREIEHLEQKNIEFSNDKNKTEADTSKYEVMDKSTKEQTVNVSNVSLTTSHQEIAASATMLRKSSRKRVATNSTYRCESSACENQEFQFYKRSADIKRKAVTSNHEEPSLKLLEPTGEKRVPTLQNSQIAFKNNLEHSSQQGMCNKLIDNNSMQNSKINNSFSTKLLCSKLQSRQLFMNLQDCTKVRTRSLSVKDKGKETIAKVGTENKRKDLQHRTTLTMKAHQSSRAGKGSNVSCHDKCQDRTHKNTTKPDDEAIITRSASNISNILKCRKTMNRKNIYGETKLHEAALNGNVNLLRTLIQAGANINLPDYAGWTALHDASYKGFHETVLVLLAAGADVNLKGLNGVTPLQDAVRNGHLQVVQLLLQHGADPFEKNDFGNCALDEALDNCMKQLFKSYQQRRKVKVGGNRQLARNSDIKNTVDGKNLEDVDVTGMPNTETRVLEMLARKPRSSAAKSNIVCRSSKMSSHNLDIAPSLKRKTESTQQAKTDVQPNKKTQNTGSTHNITENQLKHIDVEQPLSRPVTRSMVNPQTQFAILSGQEITQSNSFVQTKSTSITINEVETKPASYNDNFQNPVIIDSTTEDQASLRRSARIRNSTRGFAVRAEYNSAISKHPSIENSQKHTLVLKPCGAVNKNKTITALKCNESIATHTGNQVTAANTEVESTDKFWTVSMLKSAGNNSNVTDGKLVTMEMLNTCNTNEQSAQLKKYPKVQVNEEILSKVATCNLNFEMAQKTQYERARGNSIHENTTSNTTSQKNRKYNLPDHDNSIEINKSIDYIPSTETVATTELTVMDDTLQKGEIKQHDHTKSQTLQDNPDCNAIPSDVLECKYNHPVINEHESRQNLFDSMTSEHISLLQKSCCSTASDSERVDIVITEYKPCNSVASTSHQMEAVILEPVIQGEHSKDLMTANDQCNNKPSTCDMVSGCKFNAETTVLYSEHQTCMDESNANLSELPTSNLNDPKHLAKASNMETAEEVNANEAGENINDAFANNKLREPTQETSKNGPEHVITETSGSGNKRNTLQNTKSKITSAEVSTNVRNESKRGKRSCKLCTTESSGLPVHDIVIPKSCSTVPQLSTLNKRNGKGETRLHHAVMKRDISSVRSLIAAGIDVNIKDNAGWTALHEASSRGLTDIIQELLKAGADVNCRGMNGVSPLQDAVSGSHYEAVKVLLQNGADPMQKSEAGKNAFDEIVDDKIKHLLETHHNSDAAICEAPQPATDQQYVEHTENDEQIEGVTEDSNASLDVPLGPPRDNCASCDVQTAPTLQNDKGLENPHVSVSQHESITITLNEMATKQEEISECELKDPKTAAQFELELTQIRTSLNEILTKHKAEKEDLVKKFRVSPGSFRQGTLQKQVTALASRQRRFLHLLQKQKTLDQKLQEYKLKRRQLLQNNSVTPGKSLTCTTESRVGTDTLSEEVQLSNQCERASAGCATEDTGQIFITCPAHESECIQGHNFLSQGEKDISANQETNRTITVKEHGTGCGNESVATINTLNTSSRNSNIRTVSASISDSSHRESNSLQSRSLETSHLHVETLNSSQIDDIDSTPFSGSSQNIPLNSSQSINNPENNFESNCNYMLLNTEKSMDTSTVQTTCNKQSSLFLLAAAEPTENLLPMNSMQSQLISQPKILKSSHQFTVMPNNSQCGGNQQQTSQLKTADSRVKDQNIMKISAVQLDCQYTLEVNARNNQSNSLVNASSRSGRQHDSKFLPVDSGTGQRKRLHLIDLIKHGLIQPGEDVLDLKLQGTCHKAELLASGLIRGKDRTIYRSPMHWIKELLGDKIPVSRKFAWSKVMYKGKELLKYNSMITTSSKTQEIQSISKPIVLTENTSSITEQHRICADTLSQIQKKKSGSSFMQLHEILLVSNEEFLPCHIMNQHWKFYAESDEWNF